MEDRHSLNSPRRILSFSKRSKKTTVSVIEPSSSEDKNVRARRASSSFGASVDHGPKPSEVYGFLGSITVSVATVLFLVWAYVPEPWLHAIGISYYPSRNWALAVPAYATVTVVLALSFYIGLNFMATPSSTSLNTMLDEFSKEPINSAPIMEGDDHLIEPISDIGIHKINVLMFDNRN